MTSTQDNNGFAQFGLPENLMTALTRMNYNTPTPVQMQAIPLALTGRDILGSAQTGTGKTGAFTIPVLAKLLTDPDAKALILSPTRELASQILDVARDFLFKGAQGQGSPIKTALLVGGAAMGKQFDQLRAKPRLIVGTPGRINDHLRRNQHMLGGVQIVVLDEADRMLDMGFSGQIDDILAHVEGQRQTLMFSATFPASIIKFSQQYLNNPARVTIAPEKVSAENITHEIVHTTEARKYEDLTAQLDARSGSIIVFVKTKHGADKMAQKLARENHSVDVLHGGLKQRQRDRAIAAFRAKETRIMIATDVAARGLDVPHIETVINYDLPQVAEDYVHRIGRTARAGAEGTAVSFLSPSERGKWAAIDRLMNPDAFRNKKGAFEDEGRNYNRSKGKPRRSNGGYGGKSDAGYRSNAAAKAEFSGNRDGKSWQPREERGGSSERRFEGKRADRPYGDRPQGDRPQGQGFKKPYDGEKRFERGDRPQGERPQGQGFKKPYDGEKRFERGDRPQGERPQGQGFKKPYDGEKRFERGDRPQGDRPQGQGFKKPYEGKKRFDRAENDQPQARRDQDGNRKGFNTHERSHNDRFDRSDKRSDRDFRSGDFRQDGQNRPFKKREGDSQGEGFKKRDDREGGFKSGGFKKRDGQPAEGGFRKDGAARPAGKPGSKPFGKKPFAGKPQGKPSGFQGKPRKYAEK